MNIKRVKKEIMDAAAAYLEKDEFGDYKIPEIRQRPVLLMGPPGIGKTQIMEQIAGECDLALVAYTITHHTRQSAVGLPFITQKEYGGKTCQVTEYTMSEIIASVYDRMKASGKTEGILFIDEINCVSETLAPTMLQFLQQKTFGNQKVPEGWIIVAAGNPPEYNKSVRDFDVVTLDRVKVIDVEPDFEVWKEYAYDVGIHSAVISYLDIHRENFFRCETTVDGKRFVTARGWEDLSEIIYAYEGLGRKVDTEVVVQYLQYPKIARDFSNYLELFYKYRKDYQVDSILSGTIPEGTLVKLRYAPFDERLQIVSLLLSRLGGRFHDVKAQDTETSHIFEFLKNYRTALESVEVMAIGIESGAESGPEAGCEGMPGGRLRQAAVLYEGQLEEDRAQVRRRIDAGQNEKELKEEYRGVFHTLQSWIPDVKSSDGDVWELLRGKFGTVRSDLETEVQKTSDMLEYAFDFMEAAFGESQEMVFFITELSANAAAMWFIGENECPRYYRYNKSLLFEDRSADVRKQLDEIRGEMIGEGDIYKMGGNEEKSDVQRNDEKEAAAHTGGVHCDPEK